MTWYERVVAAHLIVTNSVSHAERLSSDRYFVWQEDGYNDFGADDIHAERAVTGVTDLFTKQEFDPWADELCAGFEQYGIAYSLRVIQYEPDTGFFHYTWDWEVV